MVYKNVFDLIKALASADPESMIVNKVDYNSHSARVDSAVLTLFADKH